MLHIWLNSSLRRLLDYIDFQPRSCLIGMLSLLVTFEKKIWKLLGTTLKYSSAFHPQIEVVNRSLSDLL